MKIDRSEHLVVLWGTARITNGKWTFLFAKMSLCIRVGVFHALENSGKVDLELIKFKFRSYFGEADIVRLSDRYGRE